MVFQTLPFYFLIFVLDQVELYNDTFYPAMTLMQPSDVSFKRENLCGTVKLLFELQLRFQLVTETGSFREYFPLFPPIKKPVKASVSLTHGQYIYIS